MDGLTGWGSSNVVVGPFETLRSATSAPFTSYTPYAGKSRYDGTMQSPQRKILSIKCCIGTSSVQVQAVKLPL
jgi:hypothetical protein